MYPHSTRLIFHATYCVLFALTALTGCPQEDEPEEFDPCENLAQVQSREGTRIASNAPGAFSFADYTISVGPGTVVAKLPNPCGNAIAERLQNSACSFCNTQGSRCEDLVRGIFETPPLACSVCGDGICAGDETQTSCAQDCTLNCGDGLCEEGESEICFIDCAKPCGNGVCEASETNETCPTDCNYSAGDGLCGLGENPINSPTDCRGETCDGEGICADSTCGDTYCQTYETTFNCPQDCCEAGCGFEEASGCADGNVIACQPVGAGNCPEVEVIEECALGCVEGACIRCPQLDTIQPCEPDQTPRCEGTNTSVLCLPLQGYEGCFYENRVACEDVPNPDEPSCVEGFCTQTCTESECDALGATQCDNGQRIQECARIENDPCLRWVTTEICADETRCDTRLGLICTEEPEQSGNLPTITEIAPNIASIGDTMTIRGRYFGADIGTVTFTQNRSAEITRWSDAVIEVLIPAGAQDGPVEVRSAEGRSTSALFNLLPTPTRFTHCAERGNFIEVYTNTGIGESDSVVQWDVEFFPGILQRGQWSVFFGGSRLTAQVPINAQPGPVSLINPDNGARITLPTPLDILDVGALDWSYGPYWEIPDTGLTKCSDGTQWLDTCPTEGSPGFGQDAHYITAPAPLILHENTAEDPQTGLIWQRFLRPERPDTTWREARCVCRSLELDGFDDWRLPTIWELMSLQRLDPDNRLYMLDSIAFPRVVATHWTSQSKTLEEAYLFSFNTTLRPYANDVDQFAAARCVRGGTPPLDALPRFNPIEDDTFQDRYTQLTWTRDAHSNGNQGITWLAALEHCNTLSAAGSEDWRLPNLAEIASLYNPELFEGSSLRTDLLRGARLNAFWSSTPNISQPSFAYALRTLGIGTPDPNAPNIEDIRTTDPLASALCVRNTPAP